MAYSRWGNSIWYTFWTSDSGPKDYTLPRKKVKLNQTFEICDRPIYHITYGDIKLKGINQIISEVKEFYSKSHILKSYVINPQTLVIESQDFEVEAKNPTDDELIELTEYINQFMNDVDKHFKWKTYFLYQWYYPVNNNIIWGFRNIEKKILKRINIFY